jgi:hypothetical protein
VPVFDGRTSAFDRLLIVDRQPLIVGYRPLIAGCRSPTVCRLFVRCPFGHCLFGRRPFVGRLIIGS